MSAEESRDPSSWIPLAALLAALALVLLVRLGAAPAANPAEKRVSDAVQTMTASGDWLVPRVGGKPRIEKPPGYTWLASAVSLAAGGASWTTVRLPSVAATLGVAALLFVWGRALRGSELGLLAALCFAAMTMTIDLGRRGVAEMLLGLGSALALFSFDRVHFEGKRAWLPVFALALWLGILAKATTALMLVGLPVVLCLLLEGSLRGALRRDALAWTALALVLGFAWYAVVLAQVPGAKRILFSEAAAPVGVRPARSTATHYGPPYLYLGVIARAAAPAVVLLPLAVWRAVRSRFYRSEPRLRFVASAFAASFVAFSLLPQKRTHYMVPLLPLLALLLADGWLALRERRPERARALLVGTAVLCVPAGLAAAAALALYYTALEAAPGAAAVALIGGAALLVGALVWSAVRFRPRAFAALAATGVLALMLGYYDSVDLCRRQLEAGVPERCPGYDQERWERAFHEWPRLRHFMEATVKARDT